MSDAPKLLLQTEKFRVVELPNGNKVLERHEGEDSLGVARWRDLRIGEADNVSRLLRDWIFQHLTKCPLCGEGVTE